MTCYTFLFLTIIFNSNNNCTQYILRSETHVGNFQEESHRIVMANFKSYFLNIPRITLYVSHVHLLTPIQQCHKQTYQSHDLATPKYTSEDIGLWSLISKEPSHWAHAISSGIMRQFPIKMEVLRHACLGSPSFMLLSALVSAKGGFPVWYVDLENCSVHRSLSLCW